MNAHIREVTDATFAAEVIDSAKPVLVDFWAAWCAPCRALAPALDAIAEQGHERLTVAKVNVDDNPAVSAKFGIRGIPTLVLIQNGREIARQVGVASRDALESWLNANLTVTA